MQAWKPCKRRDFIRKLRALGFAGPFRGSRHEFMTWNQHRLALPSYDEYSVPLLRMMIREVETLLGRSLSAKEWEQLDR